MSVLELSKAASAVAERRRANSVACDDGDVPTIYPSVDLVRTVDEAIAAWRSDPQIFVRSGALTRVIESDGADGGPVARDLGAPVMRRPAPQWITERLSRHALFLKKTTKGRGANKEEVGVRTPPPAWIAQHVIARGTWPGYRRLAGVVTSPTVRVDGSIVQVPGYDDASQLLYVPRAKYPEVPNEPTVTEAIGARDRLLDVIVDFPLTDEGRAGWLALLFTLCARELVTGAAPLFAVDAPAAGTGKGLLVRSAHMIAFGLDIAHMSLPPDDEEFRKQITTTLLAGDPAVLLDNVSAPLGGDSLEAIVTAPIWKVRLLGKNEDSGALEPRIVWTASGNGIQLVGDMGRRTLRIRLESPHENPEERNDYKRADRAGEGLFLAWVRAHRTELVVDALTCIRSWHVHGRHGDVRNWGSFESWTATIAKCVQWLGLPDPTLARGTQDTTLDPTRTALSIVYAAIERLGGERGVTAGDLVRVAFPPPRDPPNGEDDLAEAIGALTPNSRGDGPTRARLLGRKLKDGRIIDGRRLKAHPAGARAVRYSIETTATKSEGARGE